MKSCMNKLAGRNKHFVRFKLLGACLFSVGALLFCLESAFAFTFASTPSKCIFYDASPGSQCVANPYALSSCSIDGYQGLLLIDTCDQTTITPTKDGGQSVQCQYWLPDSAKKIPLPPQKVTLVCDRGTLSQFTKPNGGGPCCTVS